MNAQEPSTADAERADFARAAHSDEASFKVAEAIAEQVWREQQLSSFRMNWNLTFQGFLFAAFALSLGAAIDSAVKLTVECLIAIAGAMASGTTIVALRASQAQRDQLRDKWTEVYPKTGPLSFPCPFSPPHHSSRARIASIVLPVTIMFLWVGLVVAAASLKHVRTPVGTKSVLQQPSTK